MQAGSLNRNIQEVFRHREGWVATRVGRPLCANTHGAHPIITRPRQIGFYSICPPRRLNVGICLTQRSKMRKYFFY